jgi:hypothetical protein
MVHLFSTGHLFEVQPLAKFSSINENKRFIAEICDVGNNRLISILMALVVIAVELRHEESSMGTNVASFFAMGHVPAVVGDSINDSFSHERAVTRDT